MSADVDTSKFEKALTDYKVATGKAWAMVIKEQSRLLVQTIIRLTPPKTSAQGRGKIATDLRRVFIPIAEVGSITEAYALARAARFDSLKEIGFDKVKWRSPNIQKAVDEGRTDVLDIIFSRAIAKQSPEFIPMDTPDPNFHKSVRVNGRIPKRLKRHGVVADEKAIAAYIKTVQKKVGLAKAGWNAAAQALSAKVPAWVSKHGASLGDVVDKTADNDDPALTLVNKTVNASPLNRESGFIAVAMRGREAAMKTSAKKQLEFAKKKSNL